MTEYPDFHGDQPLDHVTDYKINAGPLSGFKSFLNNIQSQGINPIGSQKQKPFFEQKDSKVAIKRGCPNKGSQCFCPGTCNEIIGYRDKLPGEN